MSKAAHKGTDSMSTRKEGVIPGQSEIKNKRKALREAGIKQCRGCTEYKILYKGGYCRTCRDKWMREHGITVGGILSSGM